MISRITDPNRCTGCLACMNACPQDAIEAVSDEYGFYVPRINAALCVNCGLCKRVCPANTPVERPKDLPKVYAAWNKDAFVRNDSTSGGLFNALAQLVLDQDGLVFGAIRDDNNLIAHISGSDEETLAKMRGSKYVQSYIGFSYRAVKDALEQRKPVLFSGTPCQIAGLRSYLKTDYDNLLTVDIMCHGVPSPMVFTSYLRYLQEKTGETGIKEIGFRSKARSWTWFQMKIIFSSGKIYEAGASEDLFFRCFLGNYCLRNCCYACAYATTQRQGDITLGDFWGYISEQKAYRNDDKGISLVMVNTQIGKRWLHAIKEEITVLEKSLQEAIEGNRTLSYPSPRAKDWNGFWKAFFLREKLEDCAQYLQPSSVSLKFRIRVWLDNHFYALPRPLKLLYGRVRRQHMERKRNNE